jgi:hypothetical protein
MITEECRQCGLFYCITKKEGDKVEKIIYEGGDIFQRPFEIETCELKTDKNANNSKSHISS